MYRVLVGDVIEEYDSQSVAAKCVEEFQEEDYVDLRWEE